MSQPTPPTPTGAPAHVVRATPAQPRKPRYGGIKHKIEFVVPAGAPHPGDHGMTFLAAAVCAACNKPILFCKTVSGATMPLDATPINAAVMDRHGRRIEIKSVFVPHFVTCTHPEQFKRG